MPTKKSTRHSSKSGFLGTIAASSRNTASSSAPTSGVHTRGSLPAASSVSFSSIGLENAISHTPVAVKAKILPSKSEFYHKQTHQARKGRHILQADSKVGQIQPTCRSR
jgi:hypothetical protein